MKKLFCMSLATLLVFTGCGSEENELISAINNSYDLDTGSITSKFNYTTEYENIDIAGTVEGKLKIAFGKDYDKVSADVNFEDKAEKFEYYVDNKGNIITDQMTSDMLFAPLYTSAPDLNSSVESIPEPKEATIKYDGADVTVNQYAFTFDQLDADVAKSMFDPIVKLGFISSEVLQGDVIEGSFKLTYNVNPETGMLLSESLKYASKVDDSLSTKTTVTIKNTYSYDETEVELPAGYGEESEAASEESDDKSEVKSEESDDKSEAASEVKSE